MTTIGGISTVPTSYPAVTPPATPKDIAASQPVDIAVTPPTTPATDSSTTTMATATTTTTTTINPNPAPDPNTSATQSTGVYTALASTNNSTIRGASLNIET